MYPSHHIIWISIVVFQRSTTIPTTQKIEKDTKKSSLIDHRIIPNLSLISVWLHLDKIIGQHHLCIAALPKHHTINLLVDNHHSKKAMPHYIVISYLIHKQQLKIKSSTIDINSHLNKYFLFFQLIEKTQMI